jgi:ribosomal protein L37AE/L43A
MLLQFDDQNRMCTPEALKADEKYTCPRCGLTMAKRETYRAGACKQCGKGTVTQSLANAVFYKQWLPKNRVNFDCSEWLDAVAEAKQRDLDMVGCCWSPGEL